MGEKPVFPWGALGQDRKRTFRAFTVLPEFRCSDANGFVSLKGFLCQILLKYLMTVLKSPHVWYLRKLLLIVCDMWLVKKNSQSQTINSICNLIIEVTFCCYKNLKSKCKLTISGSSHKKSARSLKYIRILRWKFQLCLRFVYYKWKIDRENAYFKFNFHLCDDNLPRPCVWFEHHKNSFFGHLIRPVLYKNHMGVSV